MPMPPTRSGASPIHTVAQGRGTTNAMAVNGEKSAVWNEARNGWPP